MEEKLHKMSCSIEFDRNKCIKCTKCVQRCQKLCVNHLCIKGEGKERYLDIIEENPCIYCGQCTLVCPVDAIREQSDIENVKALIADEEKIVIVQCAPSVRTSIGEIFKMEHSINIEKKLNTALRQVGFDKVFDVNFGADITTIVEAEELIERLNGEGKLPMFTSCCPSWVAYVEKYHPELKDNLTTARSPQIHSAIAYKTWWAEKNNIDPKKIAVVSIMPCTSKKHEAILESSKINDMKPVDYVLTVRELGKLLKENNIDLNTLEESECDKYGEYTGASVIYGASGGVMESALRTSYKMITGNDLENIELKEVRTDMIGFKSAEIKIADKTVKVAVVAGMQNVEKLLEELKNNSNSYQYIEVMNCISGCINGGGQPLLPIKPGADVELIGKRREILYNIDQNKNKRLAHKNELVKEYLDWLENNNNKYLKHKALHYK